MQGKVMHNTTSLQRRNFVGASDHGKMAHASQPFGAAVLALTLLAFGAVVSPDSFAQSLTLRDAIEMTLQRNPAMRIAMTRIDAERGRFWQAVSPPSPIVSLEYDFIPTGAAIKDYGERSFRIEQSIDFPLALIMRGSAARTGISIAEKDARTVALMLATHVKETYVTAQACAARLLLARENAAIADTFAIQADARYKAGEATNLERLTAGVQRAQAVTELEIAAHELQSAKHTLMSLCMLSTDATAPVPELSDSLAFQPSAVPAVTADQLTESHPEVLLSLERLHLAGIERSLSWAHLLPSISASYATQKESGLGGLYGLGLGLSVPLWFMFEHRGRIEEAAAVHDIAEAELEQTRARIQAEISKCMLDLHIAEHQVIMYRNDILPGAEEAYRTAAIYYRSGEISYLEYLQSRQTVISARQTHINALMAFQLAKARLERALGIITDDFINNTGTR
jgi:outer membrane protein TolC